MGKVSMDGGLSGINQGGEDCKVKFIFISSSSSSGSSDDEEEEEGDDMGKRGSCVKEREGEKMDMEEGEIVASDPEEMVAFSGDKYNEDEGGSVIATLGPPRSKNELTVLQ